MEKKSLPPIPAKRYFTIGEVGDLCGVKPYVLRYWEQEFTQLKPMKRRGNRRYYQHHEVLLIRRIRELLYDQGFTISGARNQLAEKASGEGRGNGKGGAVAAGRAHRDASPPATGVHGTSHSAAEPPDVDAVQLAFTPASMRRELQAIRALLGD
jgi:DNA-binding transcriptional MerR regulator